MVAFRNVTKYARLSYIYDFYALAFSLEKITVDCVQKFRQLNYPLGRYQASYRLIVSTLWFICQLIVCTILEDSYDMLIFLSITWFLFVIA